MELLAITKKFLLSALLNLPDPYAKFRTKLNEVLFS
jgi:hypothetical protein